MGKCAYCHQKKGKRSCMALDGDICNLCCGQHREKDIRCPTNCAFVSNKQTFYVQKDEDAFLEHIVRFFNNVYKESKESGKNFLIFLDTKLYEHFHDRPNPKDSDVVSLLTALRARLSPVQLVIHYEATSLRSVWERVEEYIDYIRLSNEDALKVVDSYMAQIKEYSDDTSIPNKWVRQFLNLMRTKNAKMCQKIKSEQSDEKDIVYTGKKFENLELIKGDENKTKSNIIIPD